MKYYVYCLYDKDVLVYVGSTVNLKQRMASHKQEKTFDRVKYCELPDEKTMLDFEKYGIYKLKPKYNKRITVFDDKTKVTPVWYELEISNFETEYEREQYLYDLSEYMEMQAIVLGVTVEWVYTFTIAMEHLFNSYGIKTDCNGVISVVAYTDNTGLSIDELCESLGLPSFDEFRNDKLNKVRRNK